jgi:hypothetical protein
MTNTLVWFPPLEFRPKKELGKKPDSIRLLYPDDHPCSTESDTVPLETLVCRVPYKDRTKLHRIGYFGLKLTPFLRTYVNRREKAKPSHLAMSE